MSVRLHTLPNGFRIATETMPGLKSAAIGVWVLAGGRHERAEQNGIAVDDPSAGRAVTDDKARGIRNYFWSYRTDTLLYLRDTGGDEDFHLFSVDLASGQKHEITGVPKVAYGGQGGFGLHHLLGHRINFLALRRLR